MSASVPSKIPDLDDDQFLPSGDDDEYKLGTRSSDGSFVIKTPNGALEIDTNLNVVIPGNLTVSGTTTQVDDIVTNEISIADSNGTGQFQVIYGATDDELVFRDQVNGDDVGSIDKAGNMQLQGTLTESTTV